MHVNDFSPSRFIKRSDLTEDGVVVTIKKLTRENVAKEGEEAQYQYCLHFNEFDKPMPLNSTNAKIIGRITGIDDKVEKEWIGKRIVIYDDPNVTFGDKIVGGIRVRAVRDRDLPLTSAQPTPSKPPSDDYKDDLPF